MERNETLEHLKQRLVDSVNRLDKQRECRLRRENDFVERKLIPIRFQWQRRTENMKKFGRKWRKHRC